MCESVQPRGWSLLMCVLCSWALRLASLRQALLGEVDQTLRMAFELAERTYCWEP